MQSVHYLFLKMTAMSHEMKAIHHGYTFLQINPNYIIFPKFQSAVTQYTYLHLC